MNVCLRITCRPRPEGSAGCIISQLRGKFNTKKVEKKRGKAAAPFENHTMAERRGSEKCGLRKGARRRQSKVQAKKRKRFLKKDVNIDKRDHFQ